MNKDILDYLRCFKLTPCKPMFVNSSDILESLENHIRISCKVLQLLMPRLQRSSLLTEFLAGGVMQNQHQFFFFFFFKVPQVILMLDED